MSALSAQTVYPLAELDSRLINRPDLSAASRTDVYFEGLWEAPSSAHWTTKSSEQNAAARRSGRPVRGRKPDRSWLDNRGPARTNRLQALSAIWQWRTVTDEQLCAFTGTSPRTTWTATPAHDLWSAGLVERGALANPIDTRVALPKLFRPVRLSNQDPFLPSLQFDEWLTHFAGQPWSQGGQYDRHNLLTTELGLRLAEYHSWLAVAGEAMARHDLLIDLGSEFASADMVAATDEGWLVAVEVTLNAKGESIEKKLKTYLSALTHEQSWPLLVLFVVCGKRGVEAQVRRKIQAHATRSWLADHYAVVHWEDWFPAPGQSSEAFGTLRVDRPPTRKKDGWRETHLFPATGDLPRPDGKFVTHFLGLRAIVGGPFWQRDDTEPDELARATERRVNTSDPILSGLHHGRYPGKVLGKYMEEQR